MNPLARRAFKPLYHLYYRRLYGSRSPLARRLGRAVERWEQQTGRGDVPLDREAWEEQYRDGRWDFLRDADEVARYSVVAGFVRSFAGTGAVLDVGCGEGLLIDHLAPSETALSRLSYLGIDLSETAIAAAGERIGGRVAPGVRFAAADAESFSTADGYDAVVLNECVYYFRDPLATVGRLGRMVNDGGVMVVSSFRSLRTTAILGRLGEALEIAESVDLVHRKGAWTISLLQPR